MTCWVLFSPHAIYHASHVTRALRGLCNDLMLLDFAPPLVSVPETLPLIFCIHFDLPFNIYRACYQWIQSCVIRWWLSLRDNGSAFTSLFVISPVVLFSFLHLSEIFLIFFLSNGRSLLKISTAVGAILIFSRYINTIFNTIYFSLFYSLDKLFYYL